MLRDLKLLGFVALVTLITGGIGFLGKDFFESLFTSTSLVAIALLFTGAVLILSRKYIDSRRKELNFKDAIILGFSQALAIIPGISRSGITISSLLFRKIDKETCFKFSFIASIPAILGATVLEARKIDIALKSNLINFISGFLASLVAGILALWLLRLVLRKAKFYYFGFYWILVGMITLIFIR